MNRYDYDKFHVSLLERETEILRDIKRTERRLAELQTELTNTRIAIDNVKREHLLNNDKY